MLIVAGLAVAWVAACIFALAMCRAAALGDCQITSSHRRAQGPPVRVPTRTSRWRQK